MVQPSTLNDVESVLVADTPVNAGTIHPNVSPNAQLLTVRSDLLAVSPSKRELLAHQRQMEMTILRLQRELKHYRGMAVKALSMAQKAVSKPRYVRINPYKFKAKGRKPHQPKSLLPKHISQKYRDKPINSNFDADACDHSTHTHTNALKLESKTNIK